MCQIFARMDPDDYAYETRSIRLGGHGTSIRLEASFWKVLETIARTQGMSLGRFLTKLHDEVLEFRGEVPNFASLLRCASLNFLANSMKKAEESEPRASRPFAGSLGVDAFFASARRADT